MGQEEGRGRHGSASLSLDPGFSHRSRNWSPGSRTSGAPRQARENPGEGQWWWPSPGRHGHRCQGSAGQRPLPRPSCRDTCVLTRAGWGCPLADTHREQLRAPPAWSSQEPGSQTPESPSPSTGLRVCGGMCAPQPREGREETKTQACALFGGGRNACVFWCHEYVQISSLLINSPALGFGASILLMVGSRRNKGVAMGSWVTIRFTCQPGCCKAEEGQAPCCSANPTPIS